MTNGILSVMEPQKNPANNSNPSANITPSSPAMTKVANPAADTANSNNQPYVQWATQAGWELGYYHHRPPAALKNIAMGTSRGVSEAIKGFLPGTTLRADMLVISETNGVANRTRVLRLITTREFPRIVLNRKANDTLIEDTLDDMVAIPSQYLLEGDFHSYFDVLCSRGTEQAVLTILTPDVMRSLIDFPTMIDVEFSGNSIFLYFRSGAAQLEYSASTKTLINAAHILMREVLDKTHPAPAFNSEQITELQRLYSVSNATKTSHYLKQFAWFSVTYLAAAVFFSVELFQARFSVVYWALVSVGYVFGVLHYARRAYKLRSTR